MKRNGGMESKSETYPIKIIGSYISWTRVCTKSHPDLSRRSSLYLQGKNLQYMVISIDIRWGAHIKIPII